jgi:hypothetical protein
MDFIRGGETEHWEMMRLRHEPDVESRYVNVSSLSSFGYLCNSSYSRPSRRRRMMLDGH